MNKAVHVTLAEPFGNFVDSQVESGRFGSAQEVVEAALRLLEDEQTRIQNLRDALLEGEQSGEARHIGKEEFLARMRERAGR